MLFRLRETAREINKATDDPEKRKLIEKTWQLQDRLLFEHQVFHRSLLSNFFRTNRRLAVWFCDFEAPGTRGTLRCPLCRISAQGWCQRSIHGLCALQILPITSGPSRRFLQFHGQSNDSAFECYSRRVRQWKRCDMCYVKMFHTERALIQPGLQCHSAPFSWKVDFESGCRMYELMLSACSAEEEECWRRPISDRISAENQAGSEDKADTMDLLSSLSLDIKSYGTALGHSQSLRKRTSIHRAATLGPKTTMSHVIIKNTEAVKEGKSVVPLQVNRSQSLLSSNHVPTLSPRRIERIRLERSLSSVWTKELLPYPGMATRRPEHPIRASAQSVMRKLSMASLASNFSKRSASYTSVSLPRSDDARAGTPLSFSSAPSGTKTPSRQRRRKLPRPAEFHNSMAFLPADFDLQGLQKKSRRMSVATAISRGTPVSNWTKSATTPTTPYPDVKIPDFGEQILQPAGTKVGSSKPVDTVGMTTHDSAGKPKEQPAPSATITKVSTKLKYQLMKLLKD